MVKKLSNIAQSHAMFSLWENQYEKQAEIFSDIKRSSKLNLPYKMYK